MFAIPRTAGWLAQWKEMIEDDETKIARPRQIYTGDARGGLRAAGSALGRQDQPDAGADEVGIPGPDRG